MGKYFARNYAGEPFVLFSPPHLTAIAVVVLVNLYLFHAARRGASEFDESAGILLAIILLVNEIGWHIWNISIGTWSIRTHLPFHLCAILVWLSAAMLLTRSYTIYEVAYFAGIGGAAQALLTPDVGIYGYPHYRFFQSVISHGSIITAAIYMTTVVGYRPSWKSLLRVFIVLNIYLAFVGIVNKLLGSNYMFAARKPDSASLLDLLGPWPWYIVAGQAICLVTFLLLYMPFAIKDRMGISKQVRDIR